MLRTRLDVIPRDRRILTGGIVAGGPASQDDDRGAAAGADAAGRKLFKYGQAIQVN
jgi:hypothetical protein